MIAGCDREVQALQLQLIKAHKDELKDELHSWHHHSPITAIWKKIRSKRHLTDAYQTADNLSSGDRLSNYGGSNQLYISKLHSRNISPLLIIIIIIPYYLPSLLVPSCNLVPQTCRT
ncbi:hypothetical protein AMECASPLE_033591 [Ameca splendens]|uniref:Uncharacterized protein n=1 Tax=Ameca splendens TaxID=208324 RepID=A0ABV0ZFP7_9TELE